MAFKYGKKEIEHLKASDGRLAAVIDKIGKIERETSSDLFASIVRNIAGQQVSGYAARAIWRRIVEALGKVTPEAVDAADPAILRSCGLSGRKVEYVKDFAAKVVGGGFDLAAVGRMTDDEAVAALSGLKGIGVWTAEMLLLFSLGRPDILSFGDLGIQRGMRMVFRHRKITKKLFAKYRRRLSPCGSLASLYFWEVAGGAVPELTDPAAPKTKAKAAKAKTKAKAAKTKPKKKA